MLFEDRREAGRRLAAVLEDYRGQNAIVLALPRGGVEVGYEIAQALCLPLDVIMARKIGAPGNPEYAIGSVAETSAVELNRDEVEAWGISEQYLDRAIAEAKEEIARRVRQYRGGRELPSLTDRTVIVVDDGIATGFTIQAALRALRQLHPGELILATPMAPQETLYRIEADADRIVCLATPEPLIAIGRWYREFSQLTDEEVLQYLADAPHPTTDAGRKTKDEGQEA